MKTKNIFLCFFPLILVSCMKVKNKNATAPTEEAVPKQLSARHELPYKIISGEEPDSYSYKFSLGLPNAQLFVNRVTSAESAVESIQTDENGEWVEQKIPAVEQTTYQFGYFQDQKFKPIKDIPITHPKDLVISETMKWSQIKEHFVTDSLGQLHLEKFHRLYFKKDSVLVTEGQNLNLFIKELYSKKAEIQTWPEGQKAASGQAGRHGGQIFIRTEKAQGKILVKLRGENGGDGLPGKADPALNGAPGKAGLPHQFQTHQPSNCPYGLCFPTYTCLQAATSGEQGGPGRKGFKGGTGFRGGNSGFIQLNISIPSEFVWNIDIIPGLGGEGGSGGPGGEGGPGGPSGEWQIPSPVPPKATINGPCPKPLDSLKGNPGEFGDKGDPGTAGIKEVSCVTNGANLPLCL